MTLETWAVVGPIAGLALGLAGTLIGVYFKLRGDRRAEDQEKRAREAHLRAASKETVEHQQSTIAALKEEMRSKVETESTKRDMVAADRDAVRARLEEAKTELEGRQEAATNFVREGLALSMVEFALCAEAFETINGDAENLLDEAIEGTAEIFEVSVDEVKSWVYGDVKTPEAALGSVIGLMHLVRMRGRVLHTIKLVELSTFALYAQPRHESVADRVRAFFAFKKMEGVEAAAATADRVYSGMMVALTKPK